MAGTLPPLFEITDDDHGGYVAVALYTLLILMVGLVVTRVFTRWYIVRSIKPDDYFLTAAAFCGITQSIFVQLALDHGLGRKRVTISDSDFVLYQKYEYGAQILLVATIAFSKISASLLVQSLLAEGYSIFAGQGLLIIVIGWATSAIFALAFQCSLPSPWDSSGRCLDQSALHIAISSINIITDILLVLLPCVVVWRVHLSSPRRNSILALFATRILVCIATGVELKYFDRASASSDKTWGNIDSSVWQQVIMSLSIIFTAIPSLGRLLVELQPAVNAFAITEQHGARPNDKYILSSLAGRFPQEYTINNRLAVHTSVLGSRRMSRVSNNKRETGSRLEEGESVRGLREGVIQQTIDLRIY